MDLLAEGQILEHIAAQRAGVKAPYVLGRGDGRLLIHQRHLIRMLHDVGADRIISGDLLVVVHLRGGIQQVGKLVGRDVRDVAGSAVAVLVELAVHADQEPTVI